MTCAEGVLSGRPKVNVGTSGFIVTAAVTNSAAVLSLSGANDSGTFVITGAITSAPAACPLPSSGWSGTFVVEDPTVSLDDILG
jgi:hypothetical protein